MQLSLFEDNRTTVFLNLAEEFVRSRSFAQALSLYDQLLLDAPGDETVAARRQLVWEWLHLLSGIGAAPCDIRFLRPCWERLDSLDFPALRSVVLDLLIESLGTVADPDRIFVPPTFHLGRMLMAAGRFEEAAGSFLNALGNPGMPRGTFLAWRGDALTLSGNGEAAMDVYLAAFLEDPFTVDLSFIRNRAIDNLRLSLYVDAEEIAEDEAPAWLPVWGWLHGVFPLYPAADPALRAADFASLLEQKDSPLPSLWYQMLAHAERVRLHRRDDRELAAVRRLLKRTNIFLFRLYLEKITGER